MRVSIKDKDKLIIIPETDFEEEFLSRFSSVYGKTKAWLKHGGTPAEMQGLVVEIDVRPNDPRD
jgi:hypothetical protein